MFTKNMGFSRILTLFFCSLNIAVGPVAWPEPLLAGALPQAQQAPPEAQKAQLAVSLAPYDVASIRMRPPDASGTMRANLKEGSFSAENVTLRFLIRYAYIIPLKFLVGGPDWIDSKTFDINAKKDIVPVDTHQLSEKQLELYNVDIRCPLQKLLEERFQVKTHHEERVMPFYGIVLTKGANKLRPSGEKSDLEEFAKTHPQASIVPVIAGRGIRVVGRGKIVAVRTTLDQLANYLTTENWGDVDRPVLNKTGLTGEYDFALEWTVNSSQDDKDSPPPSLFVAIEEQLGLKWSYKKALSR